MACFYSAALAWNPTAVDSQEIFELAEARTGLDDPKYIEALAAGKRLASEGIDGALAADKLDAIIAITGGPSAFSDPAGVARGAAINVATILPALSGYPHLTVPMGLANGLPVGISFIGPAWSDAELLAMGYAYEQATMRRVPPTYVRSLSLTPETARALAPAQ